MVPGLLSTVMPCLRANPERGRNLGFPTRRQGHAKPRGNQGAFSGLQQQGLREVGAQVQARRLGGGILR